MPGGLTTDGGGAGEMVAEGCSVVVVIITLFCFNKPNVHKPSLPLPASLCEGEGEGGGE